MAIKIALINLPLNVTGLSADFDEPERSLYPPLGLLALATLAKLKKPDLHIEILDGQVISIKEILKIVHKLSPAIVGISSFAPTYGNVLKIARFSKKIGAKVILGGHHAVSLATQILLRRGPYSDDYCIDGIVQNDGEQAFYKIAIGEPFGKIPNLIFSPSSGSIKMNRVETLDFDSLPIADRDLVNLDSYFKTQRALNIFSKIGCKWRNLSGGCIFCSRMHNEMRSKSPVNFWREVSFLREKYNVETIFDGRDDFLDDRKWLNKVYELSFNYADRPALTIFASADTIDFQTIEILKKLNVSNVILGLESGDRTMLRSMHKKAFPKINERAVRILSEARIGLFASFILGAPQENKESLHRSIMFAAKIKNLFNKTGAPFSIKTFFFTPIPGSIAFKWLLKKTGTKYLREDTMDCNSLRRDWVDNFCHTTYDEIVAAVVEMNQFNNNPIKLNKFSIK